MSLVFLGLPNPMGRKSMIVSPGGPEPVAGESDNLKNEEPSLTARISSRDPKKSWWDLSTYGDTFTFEAAAISNHNLTQNGYWRVCSSFEYIKIDPDSFSATNNITGGVLDLVTTDINVNDGTYVEPTTITSSAYFECDFSQVATNSKLGEAMACVCLGVRHFLFESITYCPTIEVELREGANLIRNLGRKAVIPDFTYRIMVFPFNPAELALPTQLQNVRVRVYMHPGQSSVAKVDSVLIYYISDQILAVDTGWRKAKQGSDFTSIRDGLMPTKSDHYLYLSSVSGVDALRLMTLDDGMELDPVGAVRYGVSSTKSALVYALAIPKPDSFVEVGLVFVGEKMTFNPGITTDISVKEGTETILSSGITLAGIAYGADSYTKRSIPDRLEFFCTRDEKMKLMTRLGWQRGSSGVFYVILEPDVDSKYQLLNSFPAVCTNITANLIDIGRTGKDSRGDDKFLITMAIEEKQ